MPRIHSHLKASSRAIYSTLIPSDSTMLSALETDLAGRVPQDLLGEADRVTISYCMLAQLLLERIACTNTALAADVLEAATEFAQCEQRMVALRQSSPNMSALVDRLLEHMEEREQEQ